jgi:hypothetical protein
LLASLPIPFSPSRTQLPLLRQFSARILLSFSLHPYRRSPPTSRCPYRETSSFLVCVVEFQSQDWQFDGELTL